MKRKKINTKNGTIIVGRYYELITKNINHKNLSTVKYIDSESSLNLLAVLIYNSPDAQLYELEFSNADRHLFIKDIMKKITEYWLMNPKFNINEIVDKLQVDKFSNADYKLYELVTNLQHQI